MSVRKLLLIFFAFTTHANAGTRPLADNWVLDWELDPYYSNVALTTSLSDAPIPEVSATGELTLYDRLFNADWLPQFALVEASVNPLPWLGVYVKEHHRALYDDTEVTDGVNLVQAVTEGFEEPYALSLFLGNVVRFVQPGATAAAENRGYIGYLASVGNRHIHNNEMVDDDWLELEWKFKGDQAFAARRLSWSFRAGAKFHDHPDIADVFYLGLRREHVAAGGAEWLANTDIEYTLELDRDGLGAVKQELFLDRNWPLPWGGTRALSFGIGVVVENGKYRGSLAEGEDDVRLILRPGFSF